MCTKVNQFAAMHPGLQFLMVNLMNRWRSATASVSMSMPCHCSAFT